MSLSPLKPGIRKSTATWHARLLRPFFVLASVSPTCESGASVCCVLSHPTCLWAAFTFFFRLPGTLLPSRKKTFDPVVSPPSLCNSPGQTFDLSPVPRTDGVCEGSDRPAFATQPFVPTVPNLEKVRCLARSSHTDNEKYRRGLPSQGHQDSLMLIIVVSSWLKVKEGREDSRQAPLTRLS